MWVVAWFHMQSCSPANWTWWLASIRCCPLCLQPWEQGHWNHWCWLHWVQGFTGPYYLFSLRHNSQPLPATATVPLWSKGTSYHSSGPGIILSPPNSVNLCDTSVNITTAFIQATCHALPLKSENYDNYSKGPHTNASDTLGNHHITTPLSKSHKPNSNASICLKSLDKVTEKNGCTQSPGLNMMGSMGQ